MVSSLDEELSWPGTDETEDESVSSKNKLCIGNPVPSGQPWAHICTRKLLGTGESRGPEVMQNNAQA